MNICVIPPLQFRGSPLLTFVDPMEKKAEEDPFFPEQKWDTSRLAVWWIFDFIASDQKIFRDTKKMGKEIPGW